MQTQTRIAIGLGAVVVVVAGYFFYNSSKPAPIELDGTAKDIERPDTPTDSPPRETRAALQSQAEPTESAAGLPRRTLPPTETEPEDVPTAPLWLPRQVASEPEEAPGPASGTDVVRGEAAVSEPGIGAGARERDVDEFPPAPRLAAAAPEQPKEKMREHVVRSGDTFSLLAVEYYGSQRYTQHLIAANPQVSDPDVLKIGMKLNVPPRPTSDPARTARTGQDAERPAKALGANQYVVKPGDTFYTIAKSRLGDGRRWPELYEINKELFPRGPHTIKPGTVIYLSEPRER